MCSTASATAPYCTTMALKIQSHFELDKVCTVESNFHTPTAALKAKAVKRSIFQTFWKPDFGARFLFIELDTKEIKIVYRLFLVNCYLLHVPRLPLQLASSGRG